MKANSQPQTDDDAALIADARNGSERAFRQLTARYEGRIARVIIGMVGRCPEAEEIGQDVFIRFFTRLDRFRGDSTLATYLTRIAINLCLDELKRRKRKRLVSWLSLSDESTFRRSASVAAPSEAEPDEDLLRALNKLDESHRAVLVLRLVEGYSTKETAEMLDLPQGTVLSRLSRAQEKIKKLIQTDN